MAKGWWRPGKFVEWATDPIFNALEGLGENTKKTKILDPVLNAAVDVVLGPEALAATNAALGEELAGLGEENADIGVEQAQLAKDSANYESDTIRRNMRIDAASLELNREGMGAQNRAAAIQNYQNESSAIAGTAGSGIGEGATALDALRMGMTENRRALSDAMSRSFRSAALQEERLASQGTDSTMRASLLSRGADLGIESAGLGVREAAIRSRSAAIASENAASMMSPLNLLLKGANFMMSAYSMSTSLGALGMGIASNGGILNSPNTDIGVNMGIFEGSKAKYKAMTGLDYEGNFTLPSLFNGKKTSPLMLGNSPLMEAGMMKLPGLNIPSFMNTPEPGFSYDPNDVFGYDRKSLLGWGEGLW